MTDQTQEADQAADDAAIIDPGPLRATMRVLLVDNDRDHAEAMLESLERIGYECTLADSGVAGAKLLEEESFDIVITDLVMNDVDGMQILDRSRKTQSNCEVIVVTGHGSVPKAVDAMQHGAINFLEKPISPNRLRIATDRAAESVALKRTNLELNQRLDERYGFENIIYASDEMGRVLDQVKRIASTDVGVMITGPTGTGKELIAQAIHQNSPRKNKPFVGINCGAVAEHLVESELFGHVKGAFTDAHSDRQGKFEYANGGTLFLDEVGDMPVATQIKLLRVLENHELTRVGDNKPIKVNVRVLSATNVDLEKAIEEGKFRSDLYYRLNVVSIHLPPLSERREDILPLVNEFRREWARHHKKTIKSISPEVIRVLNNQEWKGNVRELRNVINNMVVLDTDGALDVNDLPPRLRSADVTPQSEEDGLIGKTMKEIEKWAIQRTLNLTGGNREEAARTLGIGARTLYRKLGEYDIE